MVQALLTRYAEAQTTSFTKSTRQDHGYCFDGWIGDFRHMGNAIRNIHIVLLTVLLAASARADEVLDSFDAGPLGAIEIGAGEAVQIRTLLAPTVVPSVSLWVRNSAEIARQDFGNIYGHEIELGEAIDAKCSPEGGRASAEQVIADPQVLGVIGTLCSGSAVEASPLFSAAGLVMGLVDQHIARAHVRPHRQGESPLPPRLFPHCQQRPLSGTSGG